MQKYFKKLINNYLLIKYFFKVMAKYFSGGFPGWQVLKNGIESCTQLDIVRS